jgi:clan AA aspartic protease
MKLMQGWWGPNLTPYIQVSTPTGELLNLIVDSGFNGELILPKSLVKKLGLKRRGSTAVELADGSTVLAPTYRGTILWFGRRKVVAVHTTKADEGLLGTELFRGCTVELDPDTDRVLFRKK